MKQFLIIIILCVGHYYTHASALSEKPMVDTLISFSWEVHGIKYQFEISLTGSAGPKGIIPGQVTESHISFKLTMDSFNRKSTVLSFKDTCNAQVSQLLFYYDHLVQRLVNARSGFFFFYEFASDGFDPRFIKYVVVSNNRMYSSGIHLIYNERKMKYEVTTPLEGFLDNIPNRYWGFASQDYTSLAKAAK